jgi:hypothetical protein
MIMYLTCYINNCMLMRMRMLKYVFYKLEVSPAFWWGLSTWRDSYMRRYHSCCWSSRIPCRINRSILLHITAKVLEFFHEVYRIERFDDIHNILRFYENSMQSMHSIQIMYLFFRGLKKSILSVLINICSDYHWLIINVPSKEYFLF